ncbi:Lactoylglutathione lyase [Dendrobium catenatum]|uniref:Lactoylglutathione lyase n=1 Tax=Dendrobium catenatum TaxID=906689 RepID=A0A2I0WE91_9ASPA|nr:Lactoylglutathione lyase [Dendrobium catenatum]
MASGEVTETGVEIESLLEWAKKDKRRFLHAVYRVGDLDRTIKCAFHYGVDKYDIGTGFGHFAIASEDIYKLVEDIRAKGGKITREPGPVKGGTTVIAFVQDPDGYIFELIQRGPTPEPLCQVMLRVGNLDRSIQFYEKYTIAMMGYADEYETTVLELTYNYDVTEYTKGNAYAQVALSTEDVYKSAQVVELVTKELGGKITRQPGPIPGINTKVTSFLDPDGWKVLLFLSENSPRIERLLGAECGRKEPSAQLLFGASYRHSVPLSTARYPMFVWTVRTPHLIIFPPHSPASRYFKIPLVATFEVWCTFKCSKIPYYSAGRNEYAPVLTL